MRVEALSSPLLFPQHVKRCLALSRGSVNTFCLGNWTCRQTQGRQTQTEPAVTVTGRSLSGQAWWGEAGGLGWSTECPLSLGQWPHSSSPCFAHLRVSGQQLAHQQQARGLLLAAAGVPGSQQGGVHSQRARVSRAGGWWAGSSGTLVPACSPLSLSQTTVARPVGERWRPGRP